MYMIIVGAGRTGTSVIEHATADRHEVVVIEQDETTAAAASSRYDCLVINADAASRGILEEAGIDQADALITTTEDDSVNLMVMMLGRDLGVETLVSSVNDPEHIDLFRELGVQIVESPHRLNGQYLYRTVQRPGVRDFMDLGQGAEIVEIAVSTDAPIVGKSLQEANVDGLIPEQTILVAIKRDDDLMVPRGETEVSAGDLVTVFAMNGATTDLMQAFTAER